MLSMELSRATLCSVSDWRSVEGNGLCGCKASTRSLQCSIGEKVRVRHLDEKSSGLAGAA